MELTATQILGSSESELRAKLDEIGPTVETHQLDCTCELCAGFLCIMEELHKRERDKQRIAQAWPESRRSQIRSFRNN